MTDSVGQICPKCGEAMQEGFLRTSVDSKSAVKVRCNGNDESFHEFVLTKWSDFAQFVRPDSELARERDALDVEQMAQEAIEAMPYRQAYSPTEVKSMLVAIGRKLRG